MASQFLDCGSWLDAFVSAGVNLSSPALLVATANPADRTVVALDRDGAASAISAITSVGAISGSIAIVTRLRAHSHATERSINANLSRRGCNGDRRGDSETSNRHYTSQ